MPTTIKDIAKLSGYSVGTVSRVINQHPDVSDEARKKIELIIKQENFQPNFSARRLKKADGSSIAIFVAGHSNLFFADLVEKVESSLRNSGEECNVIYIDEKRNPVIEALRIQNEYNPKGMIFLGGNINEFKKDFADIQCPSVLLTNRAESLPFENLSSFSTDDASASRAVAQYLIKQGHEIICVLGGSKEYSQTSNLRLETIMDELDKQHIPFDEEKQYMECRYNLKDGYEGTKKLLELVPDLTAIFALSDTIAIGAIRAIHDVGKRVPEDISIVGYDGIAVGKYSIPRLTTIQQNTTGIAEKGVDNLLLRLNYKKDNVHELIPFEFIEGESVKDLKEAKE